MRAIVQTAGALALSAFLASTALAGAARENPIDPNDVGSGNLLRITEAGAIPLPMTDIAIDLTISGVVIDGCLRQQFINPSDETIEALYVFPLAADSAVYAMEMRVGERRIVAEVREREQAEREYVQARESGRKASLVRQSRANLFRTRVANIGPGEIVEVELRFVQTATRVGAEYQLRVPLAVTPRYTPRDGEPLPESNLKHALRARLRVEFAAGLDLARIESSSHPLARQGQSSPIVLEPRAGSAATDRDFLLAWNPVATAVPQLASFVETRAGERYAMILVVPPETNSVLGAGLPTETLFVVDVSGSMQGPSIEQARRALVSALGRLRTGDRFNILKFNGLSEAYSETFVQADEDAIARAGDWVDALQADGGTEIYPALDRALDLVGQGSSGHASRIVFLTDGAVSNEQELLRAIGARLGQTRLHTIGIGAAPNAYLMRKMAAQGHGLCAFIADVAEADNRIARFFERLERPVWTDLKLDWSGVQIEGLYPQRLPDLHAGEPLVLTARLEGHVPGALTIGGWSVDGWTERRVELEAGDEERPGIARLWARAQIESLMDGLLQGADPDVVRAEVTQLGLAFQLVTQYTSLVAVETYVNELSAGTVDARALPQTGTAQPLRRRVALLLAVSGLFGLTILRRVT